jgi:hypothetical protein
MKRPIILDTEWVRPFDTGLDPSICMTCSKQEARWGIGKPPNGYFSCAGCFLYTSPWGKANVEHIREFVESVEESMGRGISENGIVVGPEADRILSSIVAISGIARSRAQRRLRAE